MIRTTDRMTAGLFASLACIALASGCGPSSKSGNDKKANVKVVSPVGNGNSDGSHPAPDNASPEVFLGNFLKALGERKANPDMLTASFKRKIARPRPNDEEQKKLGYNTPKVEEFLAKAGVGRFDPLDKAQAAEGPFFFGKVSGAAGKPEVCLIRLVSTNDPAAWQVDWFHRSAANGPPITLNNPGPELIGAQLAAHEFLENLLGGDLILAEAVLAKSWKVRAYESKNPSDVDLGYNQALVLQRLHGWGKDVTEFTIDKRDIAAGKPAAFEGKLLSADKKVEKVYSLKINKVDGEWVVEEVEVK